MMLGRHWSLIVGVGLIGALLSVVGTLAVQRQLDGREVSHDVRSPADQSAQSRDESSELAAYVRAFNRRRGIVAAAKYGAFSCAYVVSNGFDWKVHLIQWGERPDGSLRAIGGMFEDPAAVVNEMIVTTDQCVPLPGLGTEELDLIDLNGNGRREVVLLVGHADGWSKAVIDFAQPQGRELLFDSADCPHLTEPWTSFMDMDDDGKYEMIRRVSRPWLVTDLIEEATKVSDDTGLENCKEVYLVYRLDSAEAERDRPP